MFRAALVLGLAAAASAAAAQDGTGFWAGGDIGVASLERSYSVTGSTQGTEFAMTLRGGYAWHPRLLLGIELGGWTLQEGDLWDPSKGEGIRTLYLMAQYHLGVESRFFVKGGFGDVKYWNNRPNEAGASGSGGVLGAGYEIWRSGSWSIAPAIDYSWGEFDGATSPPGVTQDQTYRAVTFRLGFAYR